MAELTDNLEACANDPDLFNELFINDGRSFWSRQREMCDSVVKYRTSCIYSGNMIGKDFWVARLIWWWLYTRENSLVIITGPSQTLLGSVTFKEVRRAKPRLASARLSKGVKTSPQHIDLGNGWQALGFSTTSIERASGQHNKQLLVIVDEASGVDPDIWDAIDSLGYERLVCIGNPIRAEGKFVDLIRQAETDRRDNIPPRLAVNAIQIPSTDSPHAHMEKSLFGLADATWIQSMYRKHGMDSLYTRVHVKAQIPEVSADTLIPAAWLDYAASQIRPTLSANHPVHATRRLAVDLAEGVGRDSSCLIVRDDLGILECIVSSAIGLPEAAALMAQLGRKWAIPAARMSYDKLGIGAKMPYQLARYSLEGAVGYAGEASPQDKSSYTNLRSEAAWKLHQRLDPQHIPDMRAPHSSQPPFCIPPAAWYPRLRDELKPLSYSCQGKAIKLLGKKEWSEILGHSPDIADALIQSFH